MSSAPNTDRPIHISYAKDDAAIDRDPSVITDRMLAYASPETSPGRKISQEEAEAIIAKAFAEIVRAANA